MLRRVRDWVATKRIVDVGEPARPSWVDELLEALQKQSRAVVKQSARVEAALTEQAARIEQLARAQEQARERTIVERAREYTPLFDALDALDEARRVAADPHLRTGLSLVAERVHGFCAQAGFQRLELNGALPDARVCRVVGTEPGTGAPAGCVQRVVRAAVVHGERVIREGEVIVIAPESQDEVKHDHMGN